jgi:hypothetical protein
MGSHARAVAVSYGRLDRVEHWARCEAASGRPGEFSRSGIAASLDKRATVARFIGYRPIHTASATMTTTAAMKISVWTFDMRHMMRRLYVDSLPPDLFHQCRRSSTIRPAAARRKGRERLSAAGLMQSAQRSDAHHAPPYSLSGSLGGQG